MQFLRFAKNGRVYDYADEGEPRKFNRK